MTFEIWIGPESATLRCINTNSSEQHIHVYKEDRMLEGETFIKEFEAVSYEEAKTVFDEAKARHWNCP